MSHSSFKLIANDEPMSQNLIIVVNKNGSVGTDTATLQNLLTSKEPPKTGVTVLRETSPTPSISDEIEDERLEEIEMLRKEFRDEHPNADEDEIEEHLRTITSVPHVTLSVENYFPPDQARKFANDVLHLGGIDNPQTLMPIDFNFRRKIVQNDHCYTPLTMSPERNPKSAKKKDPSNLVKATKKDAPVKTKARQSTSAVITEEENSGDSEGSDMSEEQSAEEEEEEEISFSESDDDNDMDFSVNDRFGKKGTKKKRKYRRHKQKNLTFKDFLLEGGAAADLSSLDEEPKKKYGKVASKKSSLPSRPSTSGSKSISNVSATKSTQQSAAKKVEKTVKSISQQPAIPQAKFTASSTFKAATTTASQIGQISIQSAAPTKSIQEREIVESIAKDLEKSFPESNTTALKKTENIPNIMQIMEPNTSAEVLDRSLSTLEHIDSADGAASIEEIGDALIAVLGNEAIDELLNQNDLMNFEQNSATTSTITTPAKPSNPIQIQVQPVPIMSDSVPSTPIAQVSASPTTPHSLPKILNKQAPQKDPIKIVKNGRVITLPVIEAPATRGAKRRAQGDPVTPVTTPTSVKTIKTEKTPSNKDPDSRNSSRRSSLNKSESRRQSIAAQSGANEEDDANSDASWNSEDDPDRLWCICKQPHNNRFMICCDKCEDWFHGTCVNVTKAQGKIMEQSNKKWLCPNCKTIGGPAASAKKDPNKKTLNQQKLTKFFSKNQKESTDEDVPKTSMCAVCSKKPTRIDSIYCSDECIQNHAIKHSSDETVMSPKTPQLTTQKSTEVKRGNILKNQEGNVIVYDKITEKLLSAKLWPHISVLQQWLSQNPNCEPVRPGTNKANILMSSISNKKQLSSALQTPTISSTTPPVKSQPVDELFSNPVKINTGNATTPGTPTISASNNKKLNRSHSIKSPTTPNSSSSVGSPSNSSSNHSSSGTKKNSSLPTSSKKVEEKKTLKRQASDEKPSTPTSTKAKVEQERQSVRNNFRSTLEKRMKDFEHPTISKMSAEEIEKFAKHLELEMFLFFNKDTKDKYKNKFRSLKFNLSDVKNKTLIEKICTKKLTPKQLVTLSASDLASEELAKWREDENKHQLEIITKSELDALSQNKIVVKTHKGEEIIETNPAPTEILMPGTEDDIETSSKVDDSHGRHNKSPLSSPSISSSTSRAKRSRSRSKSRGHDHHSHHHHKSSSSSSKHKRRSRSKSRSGDHHSSHGSSREKSRSRHSDVEKHHRDKSRSNDTEKSSSKSKEKSHHHSSSSHHSHHHHHHQHQHHHEKDKKEAPPKEKKPLEIEPQQEDVDLVGKILDSMGVHLDIQPNNKPEEKDKVEEKIEEVSSTDPIVESKIEKVVEPINEHRLEIEIYSGSMYMADIAKFDVTASVVSGNVDDVMKKFSPTMEIVGRIEPKTVWEYLEKVKKLPGKELVILRFASTNQDAYFTLFSYLHTRQRYGVIRKPCHTIKDFYLITVEANRPLPNVLLPIDGPGFIEGDEHKPDLLIGVMLKILPESKNVKKPPKEIVKKPSKPPVEHTVPIELVPARHKSHHHHHHGSGSKLVMGLPEISDDLKESSPSPSDDEPYEPMDEDVEELHRTTSSTSVSSKLNTSDDLESQMEQINRQIELRQMEIQKLAQQKAMELDEASASRIFEKISVPHNLSEILSTIKASSESKPMEIDADDDDDLEYVPMATTSSQSNAEYRASTSYAPIVNSMMDIDERINHLFRAQEMPATSAPSQQPPQSASRLASMSDADLLKLVPDNAFELAVPPPPVINNEPAIPGLEYSNVDN